MVMNGDNNRVNKTCGRWFYRQYRSPCGNTGMGNFSNKNLCFYTGLSRNPCGLRLLYFSVRFLNWHIFWMGRRRKPIILGWTMAVDYQNLVHKLLIVMGFVPLPILRLLITTSAKVSPLMVKLSPKGISCGTRTTLRQAQGKRLGLIRPCWAWRSTTGSVRTGITNKLSLMYLNT